MLTIYQQYDINTETRNTSRAESRGTMADEALSEQFRSLYTEWGDAIANQRHDWLDGFFIHDFLGTAPPWPTLNVNRQQMLDLDKAVVAMDTEWVRVCAHQFGDTVITVGYVRYNREDFQG